MKEVNTTISDSHPILLNAIDKLAITIVAVGLGKISSTIHISGDDHTSYTSS